MRSATVTRIIPSCETSEGRYQVAELEDGRFALVIGDIRLKVRGALRIDPVDKGSIHYYDELPALQEAWEACERTFADSGDEESANELEAAQC